jgi:four helix bundle protein
MEYFQNISERCIKISLLFPKSEKFGLNSQVRRNSSSICSNLAEGSGRNSNK